MGKKIQAVDNYYAESVGTIPILHFALNVYWVLVTGVKTF